jgi:hypothetical protein
MTTTVLTIVVLIIATCIGSLIYGVQKAKKKKNGLPPESQFNWEPSQEELQAVGEQQ